MGGYIANFIVYVMAMTGLICFAVFIYKKVMDGSFCKNNSDNFLGIEETINLNPRKTLHVIRAGNEKFLIASDVDRTTLISKLGTEQISTGYQTPVSVKMPEAIFPINEKIRQTEPPVKQKIHLEPVKSNNPAIRKGMDRREAYRPKTVELDLNTPVNHGFSTMKEMAKKINEL